MEPKRLENYVSREATIEWLTATYFISASMSDGRVAEIIIRKPINAGETAFNYRASQHECNPFYNREPSYFFASNISGRHHFIHTPRD